jgi:hypothetical protein
MKFATESVKMPLYLGNQEVLDRKSDLGAIPVAMIKKRTKFCFHGDQMDSCQWQPIWTRVALTSTRQLLS